MQSTVLLIITMAMTSTFNPGIWAQTNEVNTGRADKDSTCEIRMRILEDRLLRLENAAQKRSDDTGPWEAVTANQAQEIASLKAQLQAQHNELQTAQNEITSLKTSRGSTFVRWGRSQCPNNSDIVYSGVAGGSRYTESGGGSNRLCLTHNPQFDQATPLNGYHTNIHGGEYTIPGHSQTGVPCAVCWAPHPTTVMVPGTKTCPQGWTTQYSGHILGAHLTHASSAEYVCVDGNPEDREGTGNHLDDGSYFMYSVASCGTLPCPPYVNGKVVTCVVCSK